MLKVGQASVVIYSATGSGMDWAHSNGVEFSTSLELRPGSWLNQDEPNYYVTQDKFPEG